MDELIFDVSIDEDGRYVAQARGNGIATDGASWAELKAEVQDLIACYYESSSRPARVKLVLAEELPWLEDATRSVERPPDQASHPVLGLQNRPTERQPHSCGK
jgi:hypothetical protein